MLHQLSIENYALISKLEIDFSEGFSVITGETGAGKSIILGALSLFLGQRADAGVLNNKNSKCIIEGSFNIEGYDLSGYFDEHDLDYDDLTIVRREINTHGKSRAFINDTPVNLTVIKGLTGKLVDIHSQYQTRTINDADFQMAVVDSYANIIHKVNNYRSRYSKYIVLKEGLNQIIEKEKKARADRDYFEFQYQELESAQLMTGEQELMEKELEILNNAEEIKTNLYNISGVLQNDDHNVLSKLAEVRSILEKISKFHSGVNEINKRIDSSLIELKDIASEIEVIEGSVLYDSQRIEAIESKLDLIYRLQHKHQVNSIGELINIKSELSARLGDIVSLEIEIKKIESEISTEERVLLKSAENISRSRRNVIPKIESELKGLLRELAMPDAGIKIQIDSSKNLYSEGMDRIHFLFNANIGGELMKISSVASGGERSRLMLAVKSIISRKNLLPTIIFDEIDMGVSGEISGKVANILSAMGEKMQVIAITHMPQIAGKSATHFLVYKEIDEVKANTNIRVLSEKERILEIAKMISNENVTDSALKTAKELLNRN